MWSSNNNDSSSAVEGLLRTAVGTCSVCPRKAYLASRTSFERYTLLELCCGTLQQNAVLVSLAGLMAANGAEFCFGWIFGEVDHHEPNSFDADVTVLHCMRWGASYLCRTSPERREWLEETGASRVKDFGLVTSV